MKYLLVYEHLDRGGIETLIVRMSNWLIKNNHSVILYVEKDGAMSELLLPEVELFIPENKYGFILNRNLLTQKFNDSHLDCIYTFGRKSCLIGGIIYSNLENRKKINFFSGIYHPREFNTKGTITLRGLLFLNYFKKQLNTGTRVFMSESVRHDIERTANRNFNESIVWPLAINIPKETFEGKPKTLKIVSIGRYVEFKNYNLYMFNVIEELKSQGFDVIWEVYGHGPLKEKMLDLSALPKFEGRVKIFDGIEYNKIPEVLKDAFVFIGMGTALLEAGSYGVPCIPSIGYNNSPNSYGFLYDLPYYACGEKLEHDPKISIVDLIKELHSYDLQKYEQHRRKTKKYVTEYGMDALMSKFMKFTDKEDIRIKVKTYSSFSSYLYILVSYYSIFRYNLALRKHLYRFKSLVFKK